MEFRGGNGLFGGGISCFVTHNAGLSGQQLKLSESG